MASQSLRHRPSSRLTGRHVIGGNSMARSGTSFVGSNPVPLITENAVAEGVSGAVVSFSAKDLARVTGKSVEAAKSWKSGDRTLNSAQLINLARNIPAVRQWLLHELGETAGIGSSQEIALAIAILQRNLKS